MQLVFFVISAFFSDYIIIMYGLMFIIIIHMYIQYIEYKHYSLLLEDKGTFSIIIIIMLIMLMLIPG